MRRVAATVLALGCLVLACRSLSLGPIALPGSSTPGESPPSVPSALPTTDALSQIPLHVGRGVRGAWFEVYFTDPTNPASTQLSGGIDGPLVAAIDEARLSVHAAMYSLTLWDVGQALMRAQRRGVDVRVVMESDNMDADVPLALKEASILMLGDRRQGSMHDKFVVIDGSEVWTGSMNFTYSGTYSDDNNMMRIRSTKVAEDYEAEFKEMFVDDQFGPDGSSVTPNPEVTVDGTSIEVYFSPDDHVESALIQLLDGAQSSIYFLAYSFTSNPLGDSIRRAAAAGITVSGVMDADQATSNLGAEWDAFRGDGIDVRLDGSGDQMHDKVMIVDGKSVALGSYNFTASAEHTNDENLIIIHNSTIAAQYLQEFRRIYALARP